MAHWPHTLTRPSRPQRQTPAHPDGLVSAIPALSSKGPQLMAHCQPPAMGTRPASSDLPLMSLRAHHKGLSPTQMGREPCCLCVGGRVLPRITVISTFYRSHTRSPQRLVDQLVRKKTSPQSHTRLKNSTRTMDTTAKGPHHLPAAPSRTRGSYWTRAPALLASPPRMTRLQVGERVHSWATEDTVVALQLLCSAW